ncbi:MAG TPA: FAD-binding oxidoreductase [Polyangiaceae bacterium]|jgi:FAD/FMN-containing dehydrogenase|nr:FAD-binding oxidoreductase [Polyangiaceae bacterium]
MSQPPSDAFLNELAGRFSADFITREPAELAEYGCDWTRVYAPAPSAVALPRTTEEVARLLRACHDEGVAVVPSGGRTGLAGGAVAKDRELVLSLSRMRRLGEVDVLGSTVRVQAGAVTEAVHRHCEPLGLTWPVDFASKGSSTVGGNIATNAGGVKVIRYGLTRNWVLGLQVVTAQGDVLELNGALEKNNTGLDLRQLFIGSEGILGVITEATLKLSRVPARSSVLLFGVADVAAVLRVFRDARNAPIVIQAYEFFTDRCLARVRRHRKVRVPFEKTYPCYVLLEVEEPDDAALETWLASLFERDLIEDGTLAQNSAQAAELWTLREGISESLSATGLPHKNDVALPVAALEGFCSALDALFEAEYPDWEICLFGHIGDGNLHVNVMKPDALDKAAFLERTSGADHAIFQLVQKYGGSISAEHGIGLLKKPYLGYSRTPAELALIRGIKGALDPRGILNPGKVIDQ